MFSFLCLSFMEWNKIGLMFSLSMFKTYVNITTSTDCYLVPGSIPHDIDVLLCDFVILKNYTTATFLRVLFLSVTESNMNRT